MQTAIPQVTLPGQMHTAEGPIDLNNMYVMHHGFRRDLSRFTAAVPKTPVDDSVTWSALADRWARFRTLLDMHHDIEDRWLWPAIVTRASEVSDTNALAVIASMQDEHGSINSVLSSCTTAFEAMQDQPDEGDRDRLVQVLSAAGQSVREHLSHEETDALPVLQRHLPPRVWNEHLKAVGKEMGVRELPFLVAWGANGLGDETIASMNRSAGPAIQGLLIRILLNVTRRRFESREQATFRYV